MTFESQGLYIVAIYIWLPPASYVVFLIFMLHAPSLTLSGICLSMCHAVKHLRKGKEDLDKCDTGKCKN